LRPGESNLVQFDATEFPRRQLRRGLARSRRDRLRDHLEAAVAASEDLSHRINLGTCLWISTIGPSVASPSSPAARNSIEPSGSTSISRDLFCNDHSNCTPPPDTGAK